MRIFTLFLCLFAFVQAEEKKYDLIWRFRNGLVNIMPQKLTIERTTYLLDDKKKETKTDYEKAIIENTLHWSVDNVINEAQASVISILKDSKLKIDKNGKTLSFNSKKSFEEQDPLFKNYQNLLDSGVAFLLDIKKREVLVTWDLIPQKDGNFKRQMVKGSKDPYDMGSAYRQLINQPVSIGFEWENERKDPRGIVYKYKYKFEKIKNHKGHSVADISVQGDILWGNISVGTVKGVFYHDYNTRLMRYYKTEEVIEQPFTAKDNKGVAQNFKNKTVVTTEWHLEKTNVK